MDAERKAIIDFLSRPDINNFASDLKYQIKSVEESVKARNEGNKIYIKEDHTDDDHKMILHFYNKSIAYAPRESEELMIAYSNRAYLLMHVNKYNEAIDSLDKALQLTESTQMKLKLYCKKAKCLAALGSSVKDDLMREINQIFEVSNLPVESANLISNIIKKTKSEVASMKKFKPKNQEFLQEKQRYNKIIMDRKKVDPFDFVEIKQTENMGRGLYAKTDFKTGDIVLIEKPCLIGPHFFNKYVFCSQCLDVAWSGIPCETCHDYIFCSLTCKNMAWKEYHDIECSITPYLILCNPDLPHKCSHMSLKFLVTLIKDYGTIGELKSKMKISKNNQVKIVHKESEQKMILFNKLMSLSHDLPTDINDILTIYTIEILICLVKYTSFFCEKLKNIQYRNLSKNEDFVFIGSLLLKLIKIIFVNAHDIVNPTDMNNLSSSQLCNIYDGKYPETRGFCMGLVSSMINHSCAPNIKRCISDGIKYVFYALEPISSGTQLLESYNTCFYESPRMNRRQLLTTFVCQCIACKEDWFPFMYPIEGIEEAFIYKMKLLEPITHVKEMTFMKRINPLIDRIHRAEYVVDKDMIQTISDMMDEMVKALPHPSLARCKLLCVVNKIFEGYYGLTTPFRKCSL
ncbi:hypothetical protein TKK_0002458 [Trichogramma kaykai]|uniref:MYND-type domain-containing protein n=1 Tax=Trichogramma kaykai TaxID=54128 RepID=A0ABD2VXN6_9HYME